MKRTVTRWTLTCLGRNGRQHITNRLYWTKREALQWHSPQQVAIQVSITYDDGKPARKKGKK